MSAQTYNYIKVFIAFIVAVVFSQSFIRGNYVVPVAILITSFLVMLRMRHSVTEVLADERDLANAGRAALVAIRVYAWIAVLTMVALHAFRESNPTYEPIAMALAYGTCMLMLIYSFFYFRYAKRGTDRRSKLDI